MTATGTATIGIAHNFETAHRLPFLGGKCENLHGHSWEVKINFLATKYEQGMNSQGISVEYGMLKRLVRNWIDDYLDHGCMLGVHDPLLQVLLEADSKVFVFGDMKELEHTKYDRSTTYYNLAAPDRNYPHLPWPTVEAVARMIAEKIQEQTDQHFPALGTDLRVVMVGVRETATNHALWIPEGPDEEPSARIHEETFDANERAERFH